MAAGTMIKAGALVDRIIAACIDMVVRKGFCVAPERGGSRGLGGSQVGNRLLLSDGRPIPILFGLTFHYRENEERKRIEEWDEGNDSHGSGRVNVMGAPRV
jgi:hypothetical protein